MERDAQCSETDDRMAAIADILSIVPPGPGGHAQAAINLAKIPTEDLIGMRDRLRIEMQRTATQTAAGRERLAGIQGERMSMDGAGKVRRGLERLMAVRDAIRSDREALGRRGTP